jgi:hypothetical protein
VERFHRTLNTGMRLFLDREDNNLEPHLMAITMSYNMKVWRATGVMPFLPYFGREAKLPVDMVLRLPDKKYRSVPANVQAILEKSGSVRGRPATGGGAYLPQRCSLCQHRQVSGIWPHDWCLGNLTRSPRDGLAPGRLYAKLQKFTM